MPLAKQDGALSSRRSLCGVPFPGEFVGLWLSAAARINRFYHTHATTDLHPSAVFCRAGCTTYAPSGFMAVHRWPTKCAAAGYCRTRRFQCGMVFAILMESPSYEVVATALVSSKYPPSSLHMPGFPIGHGPEVGLFHCALQSAASADLSQTNTRRTHMVPACVCVH